VRTIDLALFLKPGDEFWEKTPLPHQQSHFGAQLQTLLGQQRDFGS
jgi:hypothetical protein